MTHSPEPWIRCYADVDVSILDEGGNKVMPDTPWAPTGDNIDRIVAAINFCRNIPTDWLLGKVARLCNEEHTDFKTLADIPGFTGLIPVCKEPTK